MRSGRLGLQYGILRATIGGRGIRETTATPRRGKLSLVESYVTPLPGVGWLQACGRTTPVKRPFHPTRYWHYLSNNSSRSTMPTMPGQGHTSSPNWVPSPSPGHSYGRITGHLLDSVTRPPRCERLRTKLTAAGD